MKREPQTRDVRINGQDAEVEIDDDAITIRIGRNVSRLTYAEAIEKADGQTLFPFAK